MKINLKSKIRYKGQEYSSVDQLPAEARSAYERAIAGAVGVATNDRVATRLMLNGQEFSSFDEMPAAQKKLYDDAMQLLRDEATKAPQPVTNIGWLTKRQVQLIAVVAAVLLAAALFLAIRSSF